MAKDPLTNEHPVGWKKIDPDGVDDLVGKVVDHVRSSPAYDALITRLFEEATTSIEHMTVEVTKRTLTFPARRGAQLSAKRLFEKMEATQLRELALPDPEPEPRAPVFQAPAVAWTILAIVCDSADLERTTGDLEERFPRYAAERGELPAQIWFWANVTKKFFGSLLGFAERLLKIGEAWRKLSGGN